MSTKIPVRDGEEFELYTEMFEPGKVFLRINGVILVISLEIWEQMRGASSEEIKELSGWAEWLDED